MSCEKSDRSLDIYEKLLIIEQESPRIDFEYMQNVKKQKRRSIPYNQQFSIEEEE